METQLQPYTVQIQKRGSYRTYEEWKHILHNVCQILEIPFLPYLWGMETTKYFRNFLKCCFVLTVPMRNGNRQYGVILHLFKDRSYRTYEEWKLYYYSWSGRNNIVLTVPMRNGNVRFFDDVASGKKTFLPYLWGMETHKTDSCTGWGGSSYRTYEEWKLDDKQIIQIIEDKVLTVPMRNGNK